MDQANPRSDQARSSHPVHGSRGFSEIKAGLISGSGTWPGQSLAESDDPFSYLDTQRNSETPLGKFNPSVFLRNENLVLASPSNTSAIPSNLLIDPFIQTTCP